MQEERIEAIVQAVIAQLRGQERTETQQGTAPSGSSGRFCIGDHRRLRSGQRGSVGSGQEKSLNKS